jgi:glycosyltransferase involved in cell wall biosynthesis
MIVKNEEAVLARCLDAMGDLMDEVIIVDTGSTDTTKEIAARYTDLIYDFEWVDDFSAARNFAFSKASMEYIYSGDADEVVDQENRSRFLNLKESIVPEIEIVQMKYGNQLEFGTVYNFDEEYRPKLFKRQRNFVWEDPIHEMVRLEPIIFDSDIVITHMPTSGHGDRDLRNLCRQVQGGGRLSKRLHNMYARELFMAGKPEDFAGAEAFFRDSAADTERSLEETVEASCVAAKAARFKGDIVSFFKYACKVIAGDGCSEICCEMGGVYEERGDYEEAIIWYYNAVYETQPALDINYGTKLALNGLARCYRAMGMEEQAAGYERELK